MFYKNRNAELVAVSVETRPVFRIMTSQPLFSVRQYLADVLHTSYAASPDDQSFIFVRRLDGGDARLVMVLDWFKELERTVPHASGR